MYYCVSGRIRINKNTLNHIIWIVIQIRKKKWQINLSYLSPIWSKSIHLILVPTYISTSSEVTKYLILDHDRPIGIRYAREPFNICAKTDRTVRSNLKISVSSWEMNLRWGTSVDVGVWKPKSALLGLGQPPAHRRRPPCPSNGTSLSLSRSFSLNTRSRTNPPPSWVLTKT